jgi:hypothetical protein
MRVGFESSVKLGDQVLHASPTDQLRNDIVTAILLDSTALTKIDKLVLVDSTDTERDSASVTPSASGKYVNGSVQITATASYTCTKVRLYSGTKMYFEGTLPSSVSIVQGVKYNVSFTITVNVTWNISTAPGTVSAAGEILSNRIASRLAGGTDSVTVASARYLDSTGTVLLSVRLKKDTTNKTFGHPDTYFETSGNLATIQILTTDGVALYSCDISPVAVTTSDSIAMSFTLSV